MPAAAQYAVPSVTAGSDASPGGCPACGSERLECLQGYFETGVTGPNGEAETYWSEAVHCLDCDEKF